MMNTPGFTAEASLRKMNGHYPIPKQFGKTSEGVHPAICTCSERLVACEDHVGYIGCICVGGDGHFRHFLLDVASC
jgi:hypothetical protein